MQRKQTLSLQLETPTLGWDLKFISVYEGKDKIIAVAKLSTGGPCDAIGTCEATLSINQNNLNAKPVQYYVLADELGGWHLQSKKFSAINNLDSIKHLTSNMQEIYRDEEKTCTLSLNSH